MNNIKKFLFVLIVLFSVTPIVFADNTIHLEVTPCCNNSTNTCNNSEKKATPYCAILDSQIPNNWDWKWESSMGALLSSFNNVSGYSAKDENDIDVYYYWNWSLNSNSEFSALNKYELKQGDQITLTFSNSSDLVAPPNETTINLFVDSIKPLIEPEIITPILEIQHHSSGGSYIAPVSKMPFDIKKALDFLSSEQKENGSFGDELYTDWASLAFASNADYQDQKEKIKKYFLKNKFTGTNLTDYERHAMALMSLNLNPYNTNGENYIEKITKEFDGAQFGDKEQINDDIFALIVLQNAGYTQNDEIIQKTINFIISKQLENGSWNDSVDITGASIESLASFKEFKETDPLLTFPLAGGEKIQNALDKALKYLTNKKQDNNWGNISSSSWALQGEIAIGNEITKEEKARRRNGGVGLQM